MDLTSEANPQRVAALAVSREPSTAVERATVSLWLRLLVIALPLLLFGIDLGTPSLWDPDEGLPAEVAREMLITHRWLTPQLNFAPFTEKPPAYFWVLAGAMSTLGLRNEAAIRLPTVLLAIAGIWLLLAWGRRHLRPMPGTFAALVLATTSGYVAIGRLAVDDAATGVLLGIGLLSLGDCLLARRGRFPWLFYVSLAVAVLCSGISVVILPAATATLFVALLREPGRLLALRPFRGLGVLLAIVAPVLGLCALHDPGYVSGLFREHSLIRSLDVNFDDYHSYSLFSLLGIVGLLMLPWGIFLPWMLRDSLRTSGEYSPGARTYLIVWLAADAIFALLSAANVVEYVVIALFPLALLTGRSLARFLRRPRPQSVFSDPILGASALLFAFVLTAPFLTRRLLQDQFPTYADKLVFSFLLIPVAAAGIGAVAQRNRMGALGGVAFCGVATLGVLYHYGSETVSAYNSMEVPADMIAVQLPQTARLVSYGTMSHTLAFYSGRPVVLLPDLNAARPLLNDPTPLALLTKERFLPELRGELQHPLYVWWVSDSHKVLLANIPPPAGGDRRILLPAPAG